MPRSARTGVVSPSAAPLSRCRISTCRFPRRGNSTASALCAASRSAASDACGRQRRDADGLEPVGARRQSVRRERRGQRGAGPGQAVLRHPLGQLHDVGRHERVVVENLLDRLDRVGAVRGSRLAEHHAGQRARADRHDHARAGARHVVLGGNAIREDAERGHGHRHRHESISDLGFRISDCLTPLIGG